MAHTPNKRAVGQRYRLRLLTHRNDAGDPTLAERLSGGLHYGSPPDNAPYPYGVLRVHNLRPYPVDAPYFTADVEVQLYYRPRAEYVALQDAADVAREAADGFVDLAAGIAETNLRDDDELPPFTEGDDPEVIASRLVFAAKLFPAP